MRDEGDVSREIEELEMRRAEEPMFAVVGDIAQLTSQESALIFDRGRAADSVVQSDVRAIIDDVRARGDAALFDMAERYDRVTLTALEVPLADCARALADIDPAIRAALEQAAANIAAFHRAQLPAPLELELAPGMKLGRRAEPLRRVGVYAPGGRAAYPSSVLMGVVPAKVAGVDEVVVCSPPGPDGRPPAAVLAACALAGADRVFALGGAGAVAALALGTATVPRVDKIVGPGNAYVTEAKQQLTRDVAIDSPAGPSEILIIADHGADPVLIAAELMAQAEHDPDAAAMLVTTDESMRAAVLKELARMVPAQPRADIIRSAFRARGALLLARTLEAAAAFAETYAPEHLLVMTANPRALLPRLRAAGTIFLGAPSSVAFGDYMTGANHVLPTSGLARAYAGLSTADFLRWTTYQELTASAASALAAPTAALADAEGLPAHALAARLRGSAESSGSGSGSGGVSGGGGGSGSGDGWRVPGRAALAGVLPYDPRRLPCELDLTDNTSLFGPAPSVRGVLEDMPDAVITRYPSVYASELKRALAVLHGVQPDNISTGCGSDDVIDNVLRAFCDAGDSVAYPEPTFGMVPVFAQMNAARAVAVPLLDGFELDADALLAVRARVTYLCRPNNPTGTSFSRAATERVCREAAGVVVVDEAYADFADDDLAAFAAASDRVLVLRTFSKACGLAGLRVGYAVGPAALIAEVEKARGPYKVSGVAEAAALAVLSGDGDWIRDRVAEVRDNRVRLTAALRERGATVWDTAANFVLLGVHDSAEWNTQLRTRGVAARPFSALSQAGECIRVSVGPWWMMERFLSVYDEVRETVERT